MSDISLKLINNKYKIEKNKYYSIKANITESNRIHVSGFKNDYIEYTVKIRTSYGKWTFKKRYEDFSKLNNKLIVFIPELNEFFPPKRLFKNSQNTIKERILLFNNYLKIILNNINIFAFEEIIDFICLEKAIIGLIIKKYNMLKINEENYVYSSLKDIFSRKDRKLSFQEIPEKDIMTCLNNDNYYDSILDFEKKRLISFSWNEPSSITPNTFVIREFLRNLSENIDKKGDIFECFENFLQKQPKWIKFTKKEINELFVGFYENSNEKDEEEISRRRYTERTYNDNNNKDGLFNWFDNYSKTVKNIEEENEQNKISGLFQQIGNYENNVFVSVGSLELLEKLLNGEYNPDSETYINVFQNMKIFEFKYMKLNNLIKKNIGGNKINLKAMKLLSLIFLDKKFENYKYEIITDEDVNRQFTNYIDKYCE